MNENTLKQQMVFPPDMDPDMAPGDGLSLRHIKAILRRRFWTLTLTFFLVFMAALAYCLKAPKTFKSSTLILVQPQEVPADYVRPTITSDATARLNTLKEQVMSRPRLEQIILNYNLYAKVRALRTMYDAVETMRQNIEVKVNVNTARQSRDAAPASFEISFVGKDPPKVKDVTATIARLFIDDNLKLREGQAVSTSKFLERELQAMREELRQKEERVRQFKEEYMGMLPEHMENNYRILSQLQQQLDSLNATLQQTEDRKVLVQAQLGKLETFQADSDDARALTSQPGQDLDPLSLTELRQYLESLQSRYSDQHPEVIRVSATISKLEAKAAEANVGEPNQAATGDAGPLTEAQRLVLVQKENLTTQLKLVDKDIQKLIEEKKQTSAQITEYRDRIDSGPRVEEMFVDLRRGYEEAQENYQSLLQKQMQAKLAENLERMQKGEQFTVLEPANLPLTPFQPNIPKLLVLGLIAAFVASFGLAFLKEAVDQTFWNAKDLEKNLHLPVIVSIPLIVTPKKRRMAIFKKMGTATAVASLCSILVYGLYMLWRDNPTLLMFLVQ